MPKVNDQLAYARRIQKHLQPYQPPRLPNTPRRPYRLFRALALLGACSFSVWLAAHQMPAKAEEATEPTILIVFWLSGGHGNMSHAVFDSDAACEHRLAEITPVLENDPSIEHWAGRCMPFNPAQNQSTAAPHKILPGSV